MKRCLVYGILSLLLVGVIKAQVPGYPNGCANCFVVSNVDIPNNNATVSRSSFYVAGWGFLCEQGLPAERVDVYYVMDNGVGYPLGSSNFQGGVARPDVQSVYQSYCSGLTAYTGWHAYPAQTPPTGTRTFFINVWRGPYYQQHTRTWTIVE